MAKAEAERAVVLPAEEEEEEEEEEGETWVKHYCSSHQILLVGEGDFSFSLSLAQSFGSASNILASSHDSYDVLITKYKQAKRNLEKLQSLGASLLHELDATKMKLHTDLQKRKFDRIIFNFPHAGFYGKEDSNFAIMKHKNLLKGFFKNASSMLRANGEIHVNHKTTHPFDRWDLGGLASHNDLALIARVEFKIEDYPGYSNKRGAGRRCDDPFPLGKCSTFMFKFSPTTKKKLDIAPRRLQQLQGAPIQTPVPFSFETRHPPPNFTAYRNDFPMHFGQPLPISISIREDCSRIFREYYDHASETYGRTDYDVSGSVREALQIGFERYTREVPGRNLNGYQILLHELHRLSISRSAWLQGMLLAGYYY